MEDPDQDVDEIIGDFAQEVVDGQLRVYGTMSASRVVFPAVVEVMRGGQLNVARAEGGTIRAHRGARVYVGEDLGVTGDWQGADVRVARPAAARSVGGQ